jgi:hypothetical protein
VLAVRAALRHRERRRVAAVFVLVAIAGVLSVGEELSWGQRIFGFGTPEALDNRQDELNVHNAEPVEENGRLALLALCVYGALAPFVLRPGLLVPRRRLSLFFGVVAAYVAYRHWFVPEPTYDFAKFSEWPELCFPLGVALVCADAERAQ